MSTVKISKIYAHHHAEPTESMLERLTDQLPDADTADRLVGRFCFVGFVVMILTLMLCS